MVYFQAIWIMIYLDFNGAELTLLRTLCVSILRMRYKHRNLRITTLSTMAMQCISLLVLVNLDTVRFGYTVWRKKNLATLFWKHNAALVMSGKQSQWRPNFMRVNTFHCEVLSHHINCQRMTTLYYSRFIICEILSLL